jgi:hypothetical protein
MFVLTVKQQEFFDEATQKFVEVGPTQPTRVEFEHSLVSLSKWESKFERAFLSAETKSDSEILEYVRMMIVTPDIPLDIVDALSKSDLEALTDYINSKQTATSIRTDPNAPGSRETITAELVYYWMVTMRVPWEAQYWHLNRLLMLIRVISVKNGAQKKMSAQQIAARNRELNAQRRQQLGSSG